MPMPMPLTRVKSCELERRVVHFGGHSPPLLFSSSCVMRVATRRSPRTCVPVYVSRTRTSTSTLLTCTSSWNAQIRLRDRFRRALPLLCSASRQLYYCTAFGSSPFLRPAGNARAIRIRIRIRTGGTRFRSTCTWREREYPYAVRTTPVINEPL